MESSKKCFVCKKSISDTVYDLNIEVNMPVCKSCKGTNEEKNMVEEMLDSLADGLVCGCI
ncbi:MAG: hypothetical protein JXR61_03760 [Prolixibacteraceae bacterium]|nr:hypothetical protein [Prolixibacteraceae bacterium]